MEYQNPNVTPEAPVPAAQPSAPQAAPQPQPSVPQQPAPQPQPAIQQPVTQQPVQQPQRTFVPPDPTQPRPAEPQRSDAAAPQEPPVRYAPIYEGAAQVSPAVPQNYEPVQTELPRKKARRRAKRERRGVGAFAVIAISLVFALLGGLGGAVLSGYYMERRMTAELEALRIRIAQLEADNAMLQLESE